MARRIAAGLASGILSLLILSVWNLALCRWHQKHDRVPGRFYLVEGHRMYLNCSGAGSPTVVIEAGLGRDSEDWQPIQTSLSHHTRVCTYDRSALGLSEPRSGPRDAETIVRNLHQLLDEAATQRPLVLAGHSGGGIYVREFAREYPGEVAAIVLIDSASPTQFDRSSSFRSSYQSYLGDTPRHIVWEKMVVWSGLRRLAGHCYTSSAQPVNSPRQFNIDRCRPEYVGSAEGEWTDFQRATEQASRLSSFGGIPLLILSRDPGLPIQADMAAQASWDREQEGFKSLSSRSWRVIARGSGHEIAKDRPDVIEAEISRLLSYIHAGPVPAFGTTGYE